MEPGSPIPIVTTVPNTLYKPIQEGNYHINQVQSGVTLSMTAIFNSNDTYNFAMKPEVFTDIHQHLPSQLWIILHDPGLARWFTVDVSLRQSSAGDWVTTSNDDGFLEYQQSTPWSMDYESTTWSVDYESTTTITDADGVTRQVYSNCSIHKIFTRRFWTVCDDKTIKIVENEGEEPLPSQLFELKLLDAWFGNEWQDEHHIIRPDTLIPQVVTTPFPNPVRMFYFGTKKIGPRSPILGSISAQLLINASALRTNSRLTEPGSIWFEVAVFSELLSPGDQVTLDQIKSRDGQPLIWVSHELPSRDFHYHMLAGRNLDTGGQPFCESVEEGDYIGVLVRAEQRSTCAVHGGQLRFEVDLQGDLGWRAYDWD